jgi:hypothetical protein
MCFTSLLTYASAFASVSAFGYYITKKKYPLEVQTFETKVAWYSLKTYCAIEETFNKLKIYKPLKKQVENYITLINKEGKEIVRHTEPEFKLIQKDLKKGLDYEFIVYELHADEKVNSNKKYDKNILLFEDHEKVSSENIKINNKVHFLSIFLKIFTDDYYNIKFNFGNDNYYIVGNKLFKRSYLNWFVFNKHDNINSMKYPYINNNNNKFHIKEDTKYSIILIDQNIKCIEINNKQYIKIEDDKYVICDNEDDNQDID